MFRLAVLLNLSLFAAGAFAADESTLGAMLRTMRASPTYLQWHTGRASETDFGPALYFSYDGSPERTTVNALSMGRKVSDTVFGWPAEVVGHIGLQHFGERGLQKDAWGASAFFKINKTVNFPFTSFPLRFALGPGLSYVSRIPVVESRDFEPAQSEKLMVYLEYNVQASLAHLLGRAGRPLSQSIRDIYIGYSVVHRSAAYGLFAETGGGINYIGFGVEVVLR